MTWSNDNRLASVVIGGQNVTMLYSPDGSRSTKTSNLGTTRYFGAEAEEKSGVYTRYPHMDVMIESTTISFLHRDHLASVKAVTRMTAGTPLHTGASPYLKERTGYAVFGEPKPATSLPKGCDLHIRETCHIEQCSARLRHRGCILTRPGKFAACPFGQD